MKEIKLTQNKIALIDDSDFESLNRFKWCALKSRLTYYAVRGIRLTNGKWTTILMHREILDVPKGLDTDHKDHNGLNNQKSNLRICTRQENMMNGNSHKNSSSRFKGVSWFKRGKKWSVELEYKGRSKHLGLFHSESEAALAYNKKAIEMFGEFAGLNDIEIVKEG